MNSAYGNVTRSRSVNMAICAGSKFGAMTRASCGASRMTMAVSTSRAAVRVPATRSTRALTSSALRVALYSASTGTKAIENEPSADSRRMKLGMRKATKKASIIPPAPKTLAYTWSRTSPDSRDRKVMELKTAAERRSFPLIATDPPTEPPA